MPSNDEIKPEGRMQDAIDELFVALSEASGVEVRRIIILYDSACGQGMLAAGATPEEHEQMVGYVKVILPIYKRLRDAEKAIAAKRKVNEN